MSDETVSVVTRLDRQTLLAVSAQHSVWMDPATGRACICGQELRDGRREALRQHHLDMLLTTIADDLDAFRPAGVGAYLDAAGWEACAIRLRALREPDPVSS